MHCQNHSTTYGITAYTWQQGLKLPSWLHEIAPAIGNSHAIREGKCHWRVSSTWNMLESLEYSDIFRYLQIFSHSKPTQPNPGENSCVICLVSSKKTLEKSAEFSPGNHAKNWPLLGVLAERDSSCVTLLDHHGFSTETNHQGFFYLKKKPRVWTSWAKIVSFSISCWLEHIVATPANCKHSAISKDHKDVQGWVPHKPAWEISKSSIKLRLLGIRPDFSLTFVSTQLH